MERTERLLSIPSIKKLVEIKRYERCIGLSFINIGKWKLEFWYCPPNYKIQPHSHNHVNIRLYLLFGHNIAFFRKRYSDTAYRRFDVKWFNMFRGFNISAGDLHYCIVSKTPLIFLNVEEWLNGNPTSASDDFQLAKE